MKQREIKFRSWNPKGYFEYWGIGDVENNGCSGTFPTGRSIRFQHQQFTGLYDKNGNPIYEGDVVKYYQPYSKIWHIHVVKWDDEWANFGLFENNNKWCKESDWVKIQEIEIIGNIFEHPHLLEQNND